MDVNNDGKLSKEEIQNGYLKYFDRTLDDQEFETLFTICHLDGTYDYSELVVATMKEKNMISESKLQAAFKMFDQYEDGSISINQMKQVLECGGMTEDDCCQIIVEREAAGDLKNVSFEEFASMMKRAS